jgi:hypothetical protein
MRLRLLVISCLTEAASPLAFTRRSFLKVAEGGVAVALVFNQPSVASAVVEGQAVSLSEAAAVRTKNLAI